MLLYLRSDLVKSKAGSNKPVAAKVGQQKGGSYVARIQVGYEKDGSPRYRYFKTEQEYEAYLKDSKSEGKKPVHGHQKGSGELEDKVNKEHKESTKKQRHSLLTPERAEKSLRLYIQKD